MGGEVCKRKFEERGPWFEIKCVKDTILLKEAEGQDASFERSLLRAWEKFKGWGSASDALRSLGKSKSKRVKPLGKGLICLTKRNKTSDTT